MKATIIKTEHPNLKPGMTVDVVGFTALVTAAFDKPGAVPGTTTEERKVCFEVGDLLLSYGEMGVITPPQPQSPGDTAKPPTFAAAARERLPDTRPGLTHKFDINGNKGYITASTTADGKRVTEIFVTLHKTGSTLGGVVNAWARALSLMLQYGVPLEEIVRKFEWHRFEPSGFTNHPKIKQCTSLVDYCARWLAFTFIEGYTEGAKP